MTKKILLGLAGVIVLLGVVSFLLPSKYELTRSITVNAPAEYVFEEVNSLEKWNSWSYWNTLDPGIKITYGDLKAGLESSYSWESEKMGQGKLIITESFGQINKG